MSEDIWPDIMLTDGEWEYRSRPGNTIQVFEVYTKLGRCDLDGGHTKLIANGISTMDDAQAIACLPEILQAIRLVVANFDSNESIPECIRHLKQIYDKAR